MGSQPRLASAEQPRSPTFSRRLAVSIAAFSVVILATALLAVYVSSRHSLEESLDDALLAIARSEIASSIDGPHGELHVHNESPYLLSANSHKGYEKLVQLFDDRGQIIAQTETLRGKQALPVASRGARSALRGSAVYQTIDHDHRKFRTLYYPVQEKGRSRIAAAVAVPIEPILSTLATLRRRMWIFLVLGTAVVGLTAHRVAKRLTTPLERISHAAASIDEARLQERLPNHSKDWELLTVTSALNKMLDRLEKAFSHQQAITEAQRRFTLDASHELRSPLSNLRGTLEVALRRPRAAEDYRQTIEVCLGETKQMARLVDELLLLARADSGQLVLDRTMIDLSSIVCSAASAWEAVASAAHVAICVDAPEGMIIFGDLNRIRQVVDNLLGNAIRHTERGTAVGLRVTHEGNRVTLAVSDCGPGIPYEEQRLIFGRFYRADPSRSRATGGLGLGLAIARTIAEAHGGQLTVESEPGLGATFFLTLPAP